MRPVAGTPGSDEDEAAGDILKAERIVREELEGFLQWRRERRVAPIIAELVRRESQGERSTNDKRALHARIMRLKAEAAA